MQRRNGFTLIELIVVIAILAIMASIGIPSYQRMILNNSVTSASNGLVGFLQMARSEAVTRKEDVTVTANGGNWHAGATMRDASNTTLKVLPAASVGVSIVGGVDVLTYRADGALNPMLCREFTVSEDSGAVNSRSLHISPIGQTISGDCP